MCFSASSLRVYFFSSFSSSFASCLCEMPSQSTTSIRTNEHKKQIVYYRHRHYLQPANTYQHSALCLVFCIPLNENALLLLMLLLLQLVVACVACLASFLILNASIPLWCVVLTHIHIVWVEQCFGFVCMWLFVCFTVHRETVQCKTHMFTENIVYASRQRKNTQRTDIYCEAV